MLLLLLFGLLLLRFATRTLFQLLFHPPPRNTLFSAWPHAATNDIFHVTAALRSQIISLLAWIAKSGGS